MARPRTFILGGILLTSLAMLFLLGLTLWLYAPALDFGFMWDDPLWFGRVVGKSLAELVGPMPDYQFYRPGTMLYNRLFLRADGTFPAPLMHAAQIGWHLLNVALVYALSRRLGLERGAAVAVAALIAWHPFAYQAVAWAAPQQPLVAALQNGAWLAYLFARRANGRLAAGLSLALLVAALAVQESSVALAVWPLLAEWALRRQREGGVRWRLALIYPLVAAGFGLLWLWLPRQSGYTALSFEPKVALYLLQGFVYPLLGRPGGYGPGQTVAPGTLLALIVVALGGLLVAAHHAGRSRLAWFALTWAGLGIVPAAVGLQYSYVSLSPRLLYYSTPGVALLWAAALLPAADGRQQRRLWRSGGTVALSLILLQSLLLLSGFQGLYAAGTAHLAEMVQAVQSDPARLLFVNFPDRYAPRRPPYPLGYWGVTLAPVSVELGDLARLNGRHLATDSCSMPWVDAEARDAGPYHVDLRGGITTADQLYQLAYGMDAVYLSRYAADGAFALQQAGSLVIGQSGELVESCCLARLAGTFCLQEAQVEQGAGQLILHLTWHSLAPVQPHQTVFVHLGAPGQPPLAQADGDAWLGMVPLDIWQPGDTIRDRRAIPLPPTLPPGQYAIQVGVYDRLSGVRLPATTPHSEPLPGDAVIVGYLSSE